MVQKRNHFLPYSLPLIGKEEIQEVTETLESGWLSKGPKVQQFEKEFAAFVGAKHAVAVNSCTAALFLALKAKGIGPGDEVITSPLTFSSTANTIIHTGATPVFADIDENTLNIDPVKLEAAVTPRTKAVVPVHFGGQSCDMDAILAIAQNHGLFVLEDAAHAVYTTYKQRMIGSIGDATAFSFYATKNLATGEGGMLTTDDEELADKIRVLSLHGMSKAAWNRYSSNGSWYYEVESPGYKMNMFDLQAALGLHQLKRLDDMQKRREEIAGRYQTAFQQLPGLITPFVHDDGRHAWHLYVLQVDEKKAGVTRSEMITALKDEYNIGTSVHFIPVHIHPYYQKQFGYKEADFPNAMNYYKRTLSLPLYPSMSDDDVHDVIEAVRDIVKGAD
ncbi:DegT/DnrJ/EryC1/StrS family aminotransferase [Bacillus subtilis]|uniref:DegT/DnrJ/EryC1/StrS family aminotransferase n=1 Tax=Bacillus subtilis TaxID=1423 RepID=UPI0002B40A40|nr:DegT/DnrJ/EryC1/StrS family aminotransferase [Bacillus subtilis]AGE65403.1 putative glutamine-dependent sugar transaminase [Bacillus subtilis XF-1]AGI30952.1 putative glutamine-dependent sugar transaminase [Bacillus subtilis subsp. subtilis str. BAB-1]AKD37011.1 glutamine-dependent sugar transaminase [Bacillus subtilis HJ5]ALS84103.1 UDP-4-amino-4,6-dideoxy-N-acetyl-beta-L-altrosamine transaminase [Bacillus subtilis subsp. subtilis]ASK25849.1 putative glutamine-dependent sugar transaminase 